MSQNRVSLAISDEQAGQVRAGCAQARAALPGLILLPPEDRKGMLYIGPRSEVFCRQTLRALEQNPQIVPPSLDLAGAQADLAALDQLRPLDEKNGARRTGPGVLTSFLPAFGAGDAQGGRKRIVGSWPRPWL